MKQIKTGLNAFSSKVVSYDVTYIPFDKKPDWLNKCQCCLSKILWDYSIIFYFQSNFIFEITEQILVSAFLKEKVFVKI